jgi:hypothetical protein
MKFNFPHFGIAHTTAGTSLFKILTAHALQLINIQQQFVT